MAMKFICAVLLVILATLQNGHCAEIERTSVLKLKDGQVRGIVQNLDGGKKIHLYQGIRYGHANRFEKARPAEPWSNVYEASTNRDACYQFGFRPVAGQPQINTFSEDCLYLSVFRPAVEAPRNRSVMVYIHAGGFEIGSIFSGILDPGYFAHDGDVIVVPINYRLGPLGFLSGGQVPGNMGLHDQILALKWVQENIHYFGGDKNKVTIFGHSACGASKPHMGNRKRLDMSYDLLY